MNLNRDESREFPNPFVIPIQDSYSISQELCGQIFGKNVTVEFGVELCGQVFGKNVTL